MSELQLALLAAGIAAVAAVWGYNALQERKHRKLAEAIFKGGQDDVLIRNAGRTGKVAGTPGASSPDDATTRLEPGFAPEMADTSLSESEQSSEGDLSSDEATETYPAEEPIEASATETSARANRRDEELLPWADPLADCLISFSLDNAVPASGIIAAQGKLRGEVSKGMHWLGRSDATVQWTTVDEHTNERFSQWLVALQLADRRGAISDVELGRFFDGIQQVAHHLGIAIELPGRSETLLRAQDLDRFCASVDVQFALSVVNTQGATFAGTKLRGVCEAAGLTLDRDGLYHYRNAVGETEFALGNLGNEPFDPAGIGSLATHGVSLFIDVPRVSDGGAAFNRMVLVARQLSQGLGGSLVDANRTPLSEQMIGTIRNKILELQQVLNQAGIRPGSARARRLFA